MTASLFQRVNELALLSSSRVPTWYLQDEADLELDLSTLVATSGIAMQGALFNIVSIESNGGSSIYHYRIWRLPTGYKNPADPGGPHAGPWWGVYKEFKTTDPAEALGNTFQVEVPVSGFDRCCVEILVSDGDNTARHGVCFSAS